MDQVRRIAKKTNQRSPNFNFPILHLTGGQKARHEAEKSILFTAAGTPTHADLRGQNTNRTITQHQWISLQRTVPDTKETSEMTSEQRNEGITETPLVNGSSLSTSTSPGASSRDLTHKALLEAARVVIADLKSVPEFQSTYLGIIGGLALIHHLGNVRETKVGPVSQFLRSLFRILIS